MKKLMHISLDDVTNIFEDLWRDDYDSIFDHKYLKLLLNLHKKYNAKFTLYCYFENMNKTFDLRDFPDSYRKEFKKNRDWLRFGFHGLNGKIDLNDLDMEDFEFLLIKFKREIKRITGNEDINLVRIHNWVLSKEKLQMLKKYNIDCFLTPDDERECYSLTKDELKIVNEKHYYRDKDGFQYYKTNIRLEKVDKVDLKDGQNYFIFTHEWMLHDDYKNTSKKIESVCEFAKKNKYTFV